MAGMLKSLFGSRKGEDINLPVPKGGRTDPRLQVQKEKTSQKKGIMSKLVERKKKVNPFDRFVAATKK